MKPTIEGMLGVLETWKRDFQFSEVEAVCGKWGVVDEEYYQAIRSLILAVGEWVKRAKEIDAYTQNRITKAWMIGDFLKDVRDFGECDKSSTLVDKCKDSVTGEGKE